MRAILRFSAMILATSVALPNIGTASDVTLYASADSAVQAHAAEHSGYSALSLQALSPSQDFTGLYSGTMYLQKVKPLVDKRKAKHGVKITVRCTAPEAFFAQYLVQQDGPNVSVFLPNGAILTGKAKTESFMAKRKAGKTLEMLKGKVLSAFQRSLMLEIRQGLAPGVSCAYRYQGFFAAQ